MKYSAEDLNRALAYMGYSTLQAKLFLARAYESDKIQVINDALSAGMPKGNIVIGKEMGPWQRK